MTEEQKKEIRKAVAHILAVINEDESSAFVGPHPPHPPQTNKDESEERV
jgi:hypothetical protein